MKKLLLLLAFLGGVALTTTYAQHCSGKAKMSQTAVKADQAAVQAAALAQNVEMRTDAQTGEVSYVRKEVCPATGKVSYAAVKYDSETGAFAKATSGSCMGSASASKAAEKTSSCSGKASAASASCCAKGAAATKVADKGAGCCSSAQKASCSKDGEKADAGKQTKKVKLVKSGV